jgi:hypothetical protein
LSVRSPLGNGYLIPALRLINPYHTAGTATGLLFQCNSGTPGYARAGIFFESNGVGWGRGTMHFATKATSQTTDVDVSNSVMKIDENGRVGIGLGADALVAKLEVNGDVHISGDLIVDGTVDGVDIAGLAATVSVNSGDISSNVTAIGYNSVDIGTNAVDIDDNVQALAFGLSYASMYAKDNTTPMTLNSAAKVKVTAFDTNGFSQGNDTSNHATDEITISGGGHYLVTLSCHVNNNAAQTHTVDVSIWTNDGATEKNMLHGHRTLTGGSGDVGSMSISGIVSFSNGDTVGVWADTSDAGDRSVTFEDISLSILKINKIGA